MRTILGGILAALTITATPVLAEYPEREIQGIIQWGAGGSTDVVSRAVDAPCRGGAGPARDHAEHDRRRRRDRPDQARDAQAADGYTLLYGRREPAALQGDGPRRARLLRISSRSTSSRRGIRVHRDAPRCAVGRRFRNCWTVHRKRTRARSSIGSTGPGGLPFGRDAR